MLCRHRCGREEPGTDGGAYVLWSSVPVGPRSTPLALGATQAQQKEASVIMRLVAESVIESAVSHPDKCLCHVPRYNNNKREIPRGVCKRCATGRDRQWPSNPNFGHRPLFVVKSSAPCIVHAMYHYCVFWRSTGITHAKTKPISARDSTPASPFKCEPRKVELLVGRCRQTSRLC